MSNVKADLLQLARRAGARTGLPPISQIYIPEPDIEQTHTEFGVIILADGSAGLYYAWLGESQQGMSHRFPPQEFIGKSPLELMRLYESGDEADCSIGLAAISAITQCIYRRAGYKLQTAGNTMGNLDFLPGDHIGMVGYFPSLVRRLREQGIRLTVIEKKVKFHESGSLVNVTPDPEKLSGCNKVIITAATLLNNSVDSILEYSVGAKQTVIVGPTAGFFPDPLFSRGITAMGGTEIIQPDSLIDRLKNDQGMGKAAQKYLIDRVEYPGFDKLLKLIQDQILRSEAERGVNR